MNTLDLHGTKHSDVSKKVDQFLYENMQRGSYGVTIITGYSQMMKNIVKDICREYGFDAKETWGNPGSLDIEMR